MSGTSLRVRPYLALPIALVMLAVTAHPVAVGAAAEPRPAPGFSVRGLDGRTFRLADHRGKAVVLDFWATWCAPCRAGMPHLDRLQRRYGRDGLVVLGLSVDELDAAEVRKYAEGLRVSFRMAMADEKLLDRYGPIRQIPTTFFINRRGEVVRRTVGYLDEETLESYVRELL